MVSCSVLGCKSRSERKIEGITFHAFPIDAEINRKWILATGKKNWTPTKYSRLCSRHFESNLLIRKRKRTELLRDAVPTMNVFQQKTLMTQNKENQCESHDIVMKQPSTSAKGETSRSQNIEGRHESQDAVMEQPSTFATPLGTPKTLTKRLKRQRILSDQRLKTIRALRQKTRRLGKKVVDLEGILAELRARTLLNEEDSNLLKSIDPVSRHFLRKMVNVPDSKKYSPSVRKFALCLQFISPRAYKYVREHFKTCLPHPKTLCSWYKCVDGNPGFTAESLGCLKMLAERTPSKKLYFALSIDEMSIRQHIQWDGEKCIGFVNYGEYFDGHDAAIAKEALVFMLTAINGSFKIPVGYFLIDGCTGEQKATLVKNCITLVLSCGVYILSLTFDGCPANFSMVKNLGCNINVDKINPEFVVNDQKIFIFPDPAHMLKLVRNTLGDKKHLKNADSETISWDFIEKLQCLQSSEGLHMANKIKKSHIYYKTQIMKVKLAAQTFSDSVAQAILYCSQKMCLSQFQGSEATVDFIKKINDLFDILNSRNFSNGHGYKKPLNYRNFSEINMFLNQMKIYIKGLTLDGQPILTSPRKVGFLGFLICICSIQKLYENTVLNNLLDFIPVYKLSQDHLECFFSAIRAKGGYNNNPTAIQFKSAYKRLVVHGEIKSIQLGNCIPLEELTILSYADLRYEYKINRYLPNFRSIDEIVVSSEVHQIDKDHDYIKSVDPTVKIYPFASDHDYLADPTTLTIYAKEIIKYITGFVVRKLLKIIKCEDCLVALYAAEKYDSFILKKDKGGLIYASADVIKVCNICEKIFRLRCADGLEFLGEKHILPKLINSCLENCLETQIFSNEHFAESLFIDNHRILLLKSIALRYFKIRICHETTKVNEPAKKIRNIHTKLVLFKGQ